MWRSFLRLFVLKSWIHFQSQQAGSMSHSHRVPSNSLYKGILQIMLTFSITVAQVTGRSMVVHHFWWRQSCTSRLLSALVRLMSPQSGFACPFTVRAGILCWWFIGWDCPTPVRNISQAGTVTLLKAESCLARVHQPGLSFMSSCSCLGVRGWD